MTEPKSTLRAFALPASILIATAVLGLEFRYDVRPWGNTFVIHDRFTNSVAECGQDGTCKVAIEKSMEPRRVLP